MSDVTIRGGFAPSGKNGAAIDASLGSSVKLVRCVIEDNVAGNSGGGILTLGALSLKSCVVRDNVAGSKGGGISTGGSSALTIDDTLFENNVAGPGRGGAIHTSGTATITNSSFVNNDALDGGAIENIAQTVDALKVGSSCFVGNRDVAVHTNVEVSQLASGNWWGVTGGPSAGGDTAGSDIVTSGFLAAPPAGCRPQELVTRGNFSTDGDLPPRWRGRKLDFAAADGATCDATGCVLAIVGDGQRNQALQTLEVAGAAGDTFTLSARSSSFDVPTTGGKYLVELQLIHADGSKQRKVVKFSPGTHGFETKSKTLVAAEAYSRLKLRVEYGRATGAVDFADVSVLLE
jgi:predicted outer membrane repeat protein